MLIEIETVEPSSALKTTIDGVEWLSLSKYQFLEAYVRIGMAVIDDRLSFIHLPASQPVKSISELTAYMKLATHRLAMARYVMRHDINSQTESPSIEQIESEKGNIVFGLEGYRLKTIDDSRYALRAEDFLKASAAIGAKVTNANKSKIRSEFFKGDSKAQGYIRFDPEKIALDPLKSPILYYYLHISKSVFSEYFDLTFDPEKDWTERHGINGFLANKANEVFRGSLKSEHKVTTDQVRELEKNESARAKIDKFLAEIGMYTNGILEEIAELQA